MRPLELWPFGSDICFFGLLVNERRSCSRSTSQICTHCDKDNGDRDDDVQIEYWFQSDYGPEQNYIRIEANLEMKARNQAP